MFYVMILDIKLVVLIFCLAFLDYFRYMLGTHVSFACVTSTWVCHCPEDSRTTVIYHSFSFTGVSYPDLISSNDQQDVDVFTLWAEETLNEDNLVLDIMFLLYYESFCVCNSEKWKRLCLLYKVYCYALYAQVFQLFMSLLLS